MHIQVRLENVPQRMGMNPGDVTRHGQIYIFRRGFLCASLPQWRAHKVRRFGFPVAGLLRELRRRLRWCSGHLEGADAMDQRAKP